MAASDKPRTSPAKLALAVRRLREQKDDLDLIASDPIAVIGMGCRFPGGSNTPEEFWTALIEGRDGVTVIPEGRWKDAAALPLQLRRGGYIDRIDGFDAAFFGIAPREAQQMDPQQRLLLEVTWEALWDAGMDPASLSGADAGAFIAIYNSDYARLHFRDTSALTAHGGIGSAHSVAAGRLSFLLNLKGPSLAIDTACSSSLVATHVACQSLRSRECSLAIVAGSSLKTLSDEVIVFSKWGMLASDGKCKTFDAAADGFVPGEGCGVIILKRLSDALQDGDAVRAVIRGTAVNHDGKTTVLTAPNGLAQQALMQAALQNAMLAPGDISYVETHGTGTSLGDPIEIEAVGAVYGQPGLGAPPCVLGAVKTNLGHLEAAAGIAGIIKTVLCLEHGEIPKNLHFHKLNPEISLDGTRLRIPTENTPWARSDKPRVAAISSFGLGGTNGHVIVEEAPLLPSQKAASARIIPLPAYAWKRERFWLAEAPTAKAIHQDATRAHVPAERIVHPLLGRQIETGFLRGKLFEATLSTRANSYLADQRLGESPMVPFAAFLEMAAAAVRQIDKSGKNSLRNFVLSEPLFLNSDYSTLQVLVAEGSVEIAGLSGSRWTAHAKGSFAQSSGDPTIFELAALQARCQKVISPNEIYDRLERTGLRYGPAFRTLLSVWSGEGESLAYLRLPDQTAREAEEYGIHPTLLDGCLQSVIAARSESKTDLFLPISVDEFELANTGMSEVLVHTRIVASSETAFSADIVVMDGSGQRVARLVGFQAKRAHPDLLEPAARGDAVPIYELAWRCLPLVAGASSSLPGRWLLIESQQDSCRPLAALIEQHGGQCEVVVPGSDSYRSALSGGEWTGIVYDARASENPADDSPWAYPEKKDVEMVLDLVQALDAWKDTATPRLWFLSSSAVSVLPSEDVRVAQAPLWGICRTLLLEYPEISPVLIDVGSAVATIGAEQQIAAMVVTEMAANGPEAMVAFRNGTRYAARLIQNPPPQKVEIEVRASGQSVRDAVGDGTVLITGGLGALGSQLARWLAAQGARSIVLTGRSASDRNENSTVAELRAQGVDVAVERVDVTSSGQLQQLLERMRATRPPLQAVFHVAGVLHDSVLSKTSWNSYCDTTAPKISGAWNLVRLTQPDPIRLMVLFSSAASVLGSAGQASYAAGNAFLDALAHHRSSRGMATLSVNWGAWASSGMAARLTAEQTARWTRQGIMPMDPAAALAALQSAIEAGKPQVAVMEMDWEQFLSAAAMRRDAALFAELQPPQSELQEESSIGSISAVTTILENLRAVPASERKSILSAHVRSSARRVLGLNETAPLQDMVALQDLGMDSLMALEMRNDLAQSLGITLAAGLLFDYPSIDHLTRHLLGILEPSHGHVAEAAAPPDHASTALESMTDEEAELLLIQELDRTAKEKTHA